MSAFDDVWQAQCRQGVVNLNEQVRSMYGEPNSSVAYGNSSYPASGIMAKSASNNIVPANPSVLDGIGKSVNDARQQINELTQRARSIADAVFGAMPETERDPNVPPSAGKADAIGNETRGLFDAIGALRVQVDRLTCI